MIPKLIELRPDRNLLQPNFSGYKLSLESVPVLKEQLKEVPDRCFRDLESQYSFLHAELFGFQNHLVHDPWESNNVYYFDTNWTCQRIQYDNSIGKLKAFCAVFKLPKNRERISGDYNISFTFLSEKFAIISDGCGSLFIVDTGDRTKNTEWKQIFTISVLEKSQVFVIQNAKLEIRNSTKQIHCVLTHVEQNGSNFETVLDWIILSENAAINKWELSSRKRIKAKSSISYCALAPQCHAIVIASERPFKFIYDSENPIVDEDEGHKIEPQPDTPFHYSWTQTKEDVIITFEKKENVEKSDYTVKCTENNICVHLNDEVLIDGELFSKIDTDLTTWTLENDFLQVNLVKGTATLHWPTLVATGPPEALEEKDQPNTENYQSAHVSTLGTQMEDCDFGTTDNENEYALERLDGTTHKATHRIYLGNSPPLFSAILRPGFPPAIAIRHDVDACLWLQQINAMDPSEWELRHENTLDAFGYVQASKQQRKYTQCSPDMTYTIICEPERHVFIYKAKHDTAAGLRNRSGPQVSVGSQKLITLEETGEVVGISVQNNVTFLLTEKFILCLQINVEE